jgi:hypothetical protein
LLISLLLLSIRSIQLPSLSRRRLSWSNGLLRDSRLTVVPELQLLISLLVGHRLNTKILCHIPSKGQSGRGCAGNNWRVVDALCDRLRYIYPPP